MMIKRVAAEGVKGGAVIVISGECNSEFQAWIGRSEMRDALDCGWKSPRDLVAFLADFCDFDPWGKRSENGASVWNFVARLRAAGYEVDFQPSFSDGRGDFGGVASSRPW